MADNTLSQSLAELKAKVGGGVDPGVMTLLEQIVDTLTSGITIDATNIDGSNLPTSDPSAVGALYTSTGTVKVSAG